MAAPAGYRTWSTADLVSAADFSTYIQDQVVGVYTSDSNRSSELASPAEGQVSFLTDTNVISVYISSAWVDVLDVDTISVSSGNYTVTGTMAFGADGSGVDVTFHSGTAGDYMLWDASEEKLILEGTNGATVLDVTDGNVVIGDGTLTVGSDGAGEDVTFHSGTSGDYLQWDSSEEKLILEGTNGATVLDVTDGNVSIGDGTLSVSGVITATSGVSGNVTGTAATVTGAAQSAITSLGALTGLTVGSDGSGGDVTFHSGTAGDAFAWDSSEEKLTITGTDGQTALDVPDGNVTITDTLTVSGGLVAPLQINAQTGTTYTFVLADAGKLITSSNGSAQTLTVPPNSSVAYAIGTQILVQAIGSGTATLAEGSGVTIQSVDSNKAIDGQYAGASLIKRATNTWSLIGALA